MQWKIIIAFTYKEKKATTKNNKGFCFVFYFSLKSARTKQNSFCVLSISLLVL